MRCDVAKRLMPHRSSASAVLAPLMLIVVCAGCVARTHWDPQLANPADVPPRLPNRAILKVHLENGEVILADRWNTNDDTRVMDVTGLRYTVDRTSSRSIQSPIPYDSIALVEWRTREVRRPFGSSLLPVYTVLSGIVTATCVADPKSCFGSCPTFYVDGMSPTRPLAEGFSGSFARALEARDVDALTGVRPDESGQIRITMRNEAMETHVVRHVRLIAVSRRPEEQVYAGLDGRYYRSARVESATACTASEGDCLPAVEALDGIERRIPADSQDLARREFVEIEFPRPPGPVGLVLAARQTFVTTFAFYQTMAYFGRSSGDFLATLERSGDSLAPLATGMSRVLGGIDVSVRLADGTWTPVGTFGEPGPIATDISILPLDLPSGTSGERITVRLSLAQGNWRLDHVALARLDGTANPVSLEPIAVLRNHEPDSVAAVRLADPDQHLVTYPGDTYRMTFRLPERMDAPALFLDTQGYYYEWFRAEWLVDEDLGLASLALTRPDMMLRRLAPAFKRLEPRIEQLFWSSRFGRER